MNRMMAVLAVAALALSLPAQALRIGPYPIPFKTDDLQGSLEGWVEFDVVPLDRRGDSGYALQAVVEIKLDDFLGAVGRYLDSLPQDNCGRSGVDNWVYSFPTRRMFVEGGERLILYVKGKIETWSCFDNPIPETVWDETGCKCFGVTCGCLVTRRAGPMKARILQQGIEATQSTRISIAGPKDLRVEVQNPVVDVIGEDMGSNAVRFLAFINYNLGAMMKNAFAPDLIQAQLPPDYLALSPEFIGAGFYQAYAGTFVRAVARVSIQLGDANDFMRSKFPSQWQDLQRPRGAR